MEGWDINLLWRDTVRPAILVGKYRLYPKIPCLQAWGVCQISNEDMCAIDNITICGGSYKDSDNISF